MFTSQTQKISTEDALSSKRSSSPTVKFANYLLKAQQTRLLVLHSLTDIALHSYDVLYCVNRLTN